MPDDFEFSTLDDSIIKCPFPMYERVRQAAATRVPWEDGLYLAGTYEHVDEILSDPGRFSSRAGPGLRRPLTQNVRDVMADGYPRVNTLLTNDPPSHTHYRNLVKTLFSPRRVRMLEPFIRATADELIAEFPAGEPFDVVSAFAAPLPMLVIAHALGVPKRDLDRFKRWSDDSVAPLGGLIDEEREVECARSVNEMQTYIAEMLESRRSHPQDDLLSDLLAARTPEGTALETAEVLALVHVLLVAGNETTTNLISSTLKLLAGHPDVMSRVRGDRSLIPLLVEESLRLESPLQGTLRVATGDVTLADVAVPEKARVLVLFGSANRDERVFQNPDTLDLDRHNVRSHLAFGTGIHFCLGAALARAEGRIAFEALLANFAGFEVTVSDDELTYVPNVILRALRALPIRALAP